MYKVKKRTGDIEIFELSKVISAIKKAFESCNRDYQDSIVEMIAIKSIAGAEKKITDSVLCVEDIQNSIESVLMGCGYDDVSKAYILYRKQHERNREAKKTVLDYKKIVDGYLKADDWRVKENASIDYSLGGLILGNSGAITANYWLSEVYDDEIANAHRNCDIHIHDLSMLSGYCAGWSLKTLIKEGFGGVPKKISSKPAKHLSTLCQQMVNFLGTMSLEWSGAQAFNSVDTLMAPFVKADNLSYKEVYQCIQSLVFGLNTPSRWGCVGENVEVLSETGFKKYNELNEGDLIYTFKDGKLELNKVNKVITKDFSGKMHSYIGRNYVQTVTPDHRVLVRKYNSNECVIKHSDEIFDAKTPYAFPVSFTDSEISNNELNDDLITLAAMVYTDGSFDFRGESIHKVSIYKSPNRFWNDELCSVLKSLGLEYSVTLKSGKFGQVNIYTLYGDSARFIVNLCGDKSSIDKKFMKMSKHQAELFLNIWASFDGDEEKQMCQYDNNVIRDQLQQIAILSGRCSYIVKDKLKSGKTTNYVKIRKTDSICPTSRVEVDYSGIVWCPNVDNGTAVFRDGECVFISGQCQPVFSNFTFDWTVPDDLAELNCIVDGKEVDFKYKDCKREMDMINKAFLEVMIDGDADGRSFSYPIPTYSITKEFDWDEESINNKLLFEMTAKYGIPYFSNYINSDMKPSDVRSMAILGTQNVIYMDKFGRISKNEIRHLVNHWINNADTKYSILMNGKFVDIVDMFEVPYDKYDKYVKINIETGQSQNFSYDHKCVIARFGEMLEEYSQNVKEGDMVLLARNGYNESDIGTYESGKIVGYYLAEGWKAHNGAEIDFAINSSRDDICSDIIKFFNTNFACRVSVENCEEKHCNKVKVFGKDACDFVSKFISGDKAVDKRITTLCYDTSLDFRKGVYDGYLETDGSKKCGNFAHTTNKNLCFDMIQLFATIGKYFKYSENKNNTRYFKKDKSDIVHFNSYKLTIYNPEIFNDDYYCVPVKSVEFQDASRINTVYNFTVNTEDHLYELPNGIITHQCCRLRLSLKELRKKNGGYFGSGDNTGSVGVVTINMPRLAYKSNTEKEFYDGLENLMNIAARSLKIKRTVVDQHFKNGLYPYTKRYLKSLDDHFSTIGLIGMNECCLNAKWINSGISSKEGKQFAIEVLDFMRNKLSDYQEMYGDLYNLEASPGEGTTYRFAMHDKKDFPDIITAGDNTDGAPYYTNSSHLPVGYTDDIFEALDHQDDLQTKYTSGTVFHAFLGEKLPSWQSAMKLTRKIAENYKLPYFTFSPTYSICQDHGYIAGEHWTCPHCGKDTEVYSRVTGYYRAVQNFNDGKAHEFRDRKEYVVTSNQLCETDTESHTADEAQMNKLTQNIGKTYTRPVLITTETCPNCKLVKQFIADSGFDCEIILASDNVKLVQDLGVEQAPTLVVFDENNNAKLIANASNIRAYIESMDN